jgi:ABC-type transport system involved in multi-copper enzyme maturation permease subunit
MKAIVKNSILEVRRKKTFMVISIISLVLLGLWTLGLGLVKLLSYNVDDGMWDLLSTALINVGYALLCTICVVNTVMIGSGSISSAAGTGMLHAIISRPLTRAEYLFGRMLGLLTVSAFFSTSLFWGMSAISAVYGAFTASGVTVLILLKCWFYLMLLQFSLLCLTQFLGVRLKTVVVAIITISLFFLSQIGPQMVLLANMAEIFEMGNGFQFLHFAGRAFGFLLPFNNIQTLYSNTMMDTSYLTLMVGEGMKAEIPFYMVIYTAVYALAMLGGAYALFRKKDL